LTLVNDYRNSPSLWDNADIHTAYQFPSANVIGTDLSPIQPELYVDKSLKSKTHSSNM
jgi:hypothetical protein